jgi:mono/diheme cytochrome c family protein
MSRRKGMRCHFTARIACFSAWLIGWADTIAVLIGTCKWLRCPTIPYFAVLKIIQLRLTPHILPNESTNARLLLTEEAMEIRVRIGLTAIAAVLLATAFVAKAQEQAQAERKTIWDGVFTEAQRKAGSQLSRGACDSCHGDSLRGDTAPAMVGPEFLATWSGRSLGELYEKIRTTMPADAVGTLRARETAELIAYILFLNEADSGDGELAPDRAVLDLVEIRPKR